MKVELTGGRSGYGRAEVLHGVSLQVGDGEVLAVIGPNGAGKTTLLGTMAGARPLWQGQLLIDGENHSNASAETRISRGIALCPEGRRIFSTLTVEENLIVGATSVRRSGKSRGSRELIKEGLDRSFELFPILAERRRSKGGALSGGQQQMLAIARALMARPRILLLDEPSLGLAPVVIHEVYRLLGTLRSSGLGMILVEESARRALSFADRAMVLRGGKCVLEGTAEEIAQHRELGQAYLGTAVQGVP